MNKRCVQPPLNNRFLLALSMCASREGGIIHVAKRPWAAWKTCAARSIGKERFRTFRRDFRKGDFCAQKEVSQNSGPVKWYLSFWCPQNGVYHLEKLPSRPFLEATGIQARPWVPQDSVDCVELPTEHENEAARCCDRCSAHGPHLETHLDLDESVVSNLRTCAGSVAFMYIYIYRFWILCLKLPKPLRSKHSLVCALRDFMIVAKAAALGRTPR